MQKVCIYHIGELYLFEYYCKPDEYEIDPEDKVSALLDDCEAQEKKGGLMMALQDAEKAKELNPVSTRVYEKLVSLYFRLNRKEDVKRTVDEAYPYLATPAELAWYYRWEGFYYLETYKPELSEVLYRYSELFAKSDQAEEEIHYLETALGKKMPDYSTKELQEKLQNASIPTGPSNVTIALFYRAGQEAEEKGMLQQALDCYEIVNLWSKDAEVEEKILKLRHEMK